MIKKILYWLCLFASLYMAGIKNIYFELIFLFCSFITHKAAYEERIEYDPRDINLKVEIPENEEREEIYDCRKGSRKH